MRQLSFSHELPNCANFSAGNPSVFCWTHEKCESGKECLCQQSKLIVEYDTFHMEWFHDGAI